MWEAETGVKPNLLNTCIMINLKYTVCLTSLSLVLKLWFVDYEPWIIPVDYLNCFNFILNPSNMNSSKG